MKKHSLLALMALIISVGFSSAQAYDDFDDHGGAIGSIDRYPGNGHGQPNYPAYPGQPNNPGYPGQPHHPGHPGNPGNPGYPGQPNYPGYGHLQQNAELVVRKLYRAILFREPDSGGMYNAVNEIRRRGEAGLADVAYGLGTSSEYYQNIAYRYRAEDIVRNMYRQLLNREGEYAGVRFWVDALRRADAGTVLRDFISSEEFRRLYVY